MSHMHGLQAVERNAAAVREEEEEEEDDDACMGSRPSARVRVRVCRVLAAALLVNLFGTVLAAMHLHNITTFVMMMMMMIIIITSSSSSSTPQAPPPLQPQLQPTHPAF